MNAMRLLPLLLAFLIVLARPLAADTTTTGPAPATGGEKHHGPDRAPMLQKILARLAAEHDQRVAERAKEYTARHAELAARLAKSKLTDAEKSEITTALAQLHQEHEAFCTQCYQQVVAFVTANCGDASKTRDQREAARKAFHEQMKATIEAREAQFKAERQAIFAKIRDEVKAQHQPPAGATL